MIDVNGRGAIVTWYMYKRKGVSDTRRSNAILSYSGSMRRKRKKLGNIISINSGD